MKTLKKTLCLVLAVVMAVGVLVIPTSAAYDDDADIKNKEAAAVLTGLKILEGDDDGNYKPGEVLTRAEAAVIISRLMQTRDGSDDYVGSANPFTDVPANHWAIDEIAYCVANGIIAGKGDDTFDPDGKLTGHEFAKMLLCALGYDAATEGFAQAGSDWAKNVENAARSSRLIEDKDNADFTLSSGLITGLKTFNFAKELARDDAAQMAYNALVADRVYYSGGSEVELPGGVSIKVGATVEHDSSFNAANDYKVTVGTPKTDNYGRPESRVVNIGTKAVYTTYKTPVVVLSDGSTAKKTLDDGKFAYSGNVYVDNADTALVVASGKTVSDAVADLVKNGATVYVYGDSLDKANKIVAINQYAGVVTKVNKAEGENKRTVEIAGMTLTTESYEKDDIVLYNRYMGTDGKYVIDADTHKAAESVTGKMTGYKGDALTIDSKSYTVAAQAVTGITATYLKDNFLGKDDITYYLNDRGEIVYAENSNGETTVSNNYAIVHAAQATMTSGEFGSFGNNATYSVKVQVVTSDGTVGVYNVPLDSNNQVKAGTDVILTATANSTTFTTGVTYTNNTADVKDKFAGVFTYTIDGDDITLTSKLESATITSATDTYSSTNVNEITSKDLAPAITSAGTGLINEKTVFVIVSSKGEVTVKTGSKALEGTTIPAGTNLVVNGTKGDTGNTAYTVSYVFAVSTEFKTLDATASNEYVYVDGEQIVSLDDDGKSVASYEVVKIDGTKEVVQVSKASGITVGAAADTVKGLYVMLEDGTLGAKASASVSKEGKILAVSGTTVQLDTNDYYTVDTDAIAYVGGAELKTDTQFYAIVNNTDKVVTALWLVK